MPRRIEATETERDKARRSAGIVFTPPVTLEDLKSDTEHDPEGAEEFVALIRALRKEGSQPVTL